MWSLLIIICIAYVINTNKTIKNLRKENLELQKKIKIISMQNRNSENNTQNTNIEDKAETIEKVVPTVEQLNQESVTEKIVTPEEREFLRQEKERKDKEVKNTSILVTGAILIVLAAIVFLMSTWSTIPNMLKTVVMILLVGVFLGASKIAKDKFNLKKASATFYYIAMAYIPLCLISCSVFGLFGGYFSLYGPGNRFILTAIMLLTSIIYYLSYIKRSEKGLFYASIISQISAVMLFSLMIENNINLICVNLLIYNIILIILLRHDCFEEVNFLEKLNLCITYIIGFFTAFKVITLEYDVLMNTILVLLSANYLLLYLRNKSSVYNSYFFNITIYSLGLYIIFSNIEVLGPDLRLILAVSYILVAFILEKAIFNKDSNLLKSSMIMSIVSNTLIYLTSYDYRISYEDMFIRPYMIGLIEEALLLISFINSKEIGKKVLSILIPTILTAIGCNIIYELNNIYHLYIVLAFIIFVIGELIRGRNTEILNKGFFTISHLFLGLVFLVNIFNEAFYNDVLYFLIFTGIYGYSFIKYSNVRLFKYLGYIMCIITIYSSAYFLELNDLILYLIPLIASIMLSLLEYKQNMLKDSFSPVFFIVLNIFAYNCLMRMQNTMMQIILTLLFSAYLYYDNIKNQKNEYLRIFPLVCSIPAIFFNTLDDSTKVFLELLVVTALTGYSLYRKRISIDTVFSGIYLLFTMNNIDSQMVREIVLLTWTVIHIFFIEEDKQKDLFKVLSYIFGYFLYNTFLQELKLNIYTAFSMIGITITALAIIKNVAIKYIKNMDNIEYITFSLIYLCALINYMNEKDGMIFVFAIVCLLMFSYMKKYGAFFVVSSLAIIINALALTRTFWFSIPWWIYLLLIGSALIAFAIKNESDDNKLSIGKVIKKVKDNIEK